MKRFCLMVALTFLGVAGIQAKSNSKDIANQLISNLHGGGEMHTVDGVTSYSGYVGTGYVYYFDDKDRFYINPTIDAKWGEYRSEGNYSMKTTSVAVPVTLGYRLFTNELIGMNLFGGVRYEQILNIEGNKYMSEVNKSQVGLTGGTSLRLLDSFSLNVSYYYGLTSLFADGTGKTSSFNISFNF